MSADPCCECGSGQAGLGKIIGERHGR
jgi:hypothetical protein